MLVQIMDSVGMNNVNTASIFNDSVVVNNVVVNNDRSIILPKFPNVNMNV
jgi:hypothetical protein